VQAEPDARVDLFYSGELCFKFVYNKVIGRSSIFTRKNQRMAKVDKRIINNSHWKKLSNGIRCTASTSLLNIIPHLAQFGV
jgi:hypothetical protein